MALIIVTGASAGGLKVVSELVGKFPKDFEASIFVVIHIHPTAKSLLPAILSKATILPVVSLDGYASIQKGTIYVAPPNKHLIIDDGMVAISSGPRENRFRPSIDALFRSAARNYGPHVVGVLLSGGMDDGVSGLHFIRSFGGTTIVQDPEHAEFPDLPQNAIKAGSVDHVLSVSEIAAKLISLAEEENHMSRSEEKSNKAGTEDDLDLVGKRTVLTCPDCGGLLWEMNEGKLTRYQCHVGHRYTQQSLFESNSEATENALWTALRALKEQSVLARKKAKETGQQGHHAAESVFSEHVRATDEAIEKISRLLYSNARQRKEQSHEVDEFD
jgi:two-component system chemotaxis response regulator CheB